jgi:hypothetical protein
MMSRTGFDQDSFRIKEIVTCYIVALRHTNHSTELQIFVVSIPASYSGRHLFDSTP